MREPPYVLTIPADLYAELPERVRSVLSDVAGRAQQRLLSSKHTGVVPAIPPVDPPVDPPDYVLYRRSEVARADRLVELVRSALSQRGDDVCWRDLYNAEVAELVGLTDFDPALLEKPSFLRNCDHFYDCLAADAPYKAPAAEAKD